MRPPRPLLRACLLAVACLLTLGLVPAASTAASAASAATADRTAVSSQRTGNAARRYAKQAFSATNTQRTRRGRVAVRQDQCLQRFANRQARRLARASNHDLPHQSLGPIMRRCNLSSAGENLAYGFADGRAAVRAWMRSPGHRANILKRSYRQMAIAARRGGDGLWYVSQVFGRRL